MTERSVKFPHVFVRVADGAPLRDIVQRAIDALTKAEVDRRDIQSFRDCVYPFGGYAMTIDEIRNWVETD